MKNIIFSFLVLIILTLPLVASKSVRKDFSVITQRLALAKRSANWFMMDIYKQAQVNEGGTIKVKVGKRNLTIDEICGYEPVKRVQPPFGLVHSFYFNTSGLDNNNTVVDAKLVFLVDQYLTVSRVNVSLRWGVVTENQTKLEPLTWKMVKLRKRFSINVKKAVKNWMTDPRALGKLEMRVWMQLGSRYRRQILPRTVYQTSKMPGIIVFVSYSKAKKTSSPLLDLLKKQTVLLPRSLPVVANTKFDSVRLTTAKGKAGLRTSFFYPSCHKSSLSIDLTKLFSWVIKPSDPVSIGLCSGKCYAPIPSSLQPTKHAIIISLLLERRGVRQPERPHCVPLELTGLKVIFVDQDNRTIKVQVWDDMIVKKCGCR